MLSSQEEVDAANNTNDQFKQSKKMLFAHLCLKINSEMFPLTVTCSMTSKSVSDLSP